MGVPYAPAKLVLDAAKAILGAHALTAVTLPALLREGVRGGVDVTAAQVPFGSTAETEILNSYFVLPRPPDVERPYRAIWSAREPWQTRKFPGGGLQRQRNLRVGKGEVLIQRKPAQTNLPGDVWGLTQTAGAELLADSPPVRVVDLALWFGRDVNTGTLPAAAIASLPQSADDLDKLVAWFVAEFDPDRGDLVGTVFDSTVPADYHQVPFATDPVDEATYEELGSLPPAPVVHGDLGAIVTDLEVAITSEGYELPAGLVRRVLTAWLRGDIVILVGQPGTGKSLFANLLGRAMQDQFDLDPSLVISIRADFDESEFIGYERLDGTPHLQEFAREVVQTDSPLEARVVILEEFNLAAIETYMASVLVAMQERDRQLRLPTGETMSLPVDTFIVATCNSFRDEPETRLRVSSPTKRRSTIITMPNVLGTRYEADQQTAVVGLLDQLIANERDRVEQREQAGRPAQFDRLRLDALRSVASANDLTPEARDALVAIANSILDVPIGRSWFTVGLLKDVVIEIVMADRTVTSELAALGQAVADKLVHQLRGTHSDVQDLSAATAQLPNADEIERLIDQAKTGSADELLPLL